MLVMVSLVFMRLGMGLMFVVPLFMAVVMMVVIMTVMPCVGIMAIVPFMPFFFMMVMMVGGHGDLLHSPLREYDA